MNDVLRAFFDELLALGVSFDDRMRLGPMERDASGDMPLHYAAYQGRVDVVRALISAGAPINAAGEAGYTPLHYAIERRRIDVVVELLASGAKSNLPDDLGRSAHDYAAELGDSSVLNLFERPDLHD